MTEVESLHQEINFLKSQNFNYQTDIENFKKQLEQYQQAFDHLQHQFQELLRYRFGRKTERYIDPEHPQIDLFAEDISLNASLDKNDVDEDSVTIAEHQRRIKPKKDTSKLPREIQLIPVAENDRACHCGHKKQVIRYETKELYHYKKAEFYIIEQRREVVACQYGCEKSIITADAPLHVLPKVKATEEYLSHVVVSKIQDRQPLYHLEKYSDAAGISRETMARWFIQLHEPLQPVINLMEDEVIGYDVSSCDATTLQVLDEPGRAPHTKSYTYCIRGGPPERAVILYAYNAEEHKHFVDKYFEGFSGAVHMDADPIFEKLLSRSHVHASYCNAHARRKFEAIAKQAKKQGLAHDAMRYYKKLYKIERLAKDEKMTMAQRYQLRQKESKPIIDEFKEWFQKNYPHVLPASHLGKAFAYCLNHWEGLTRFLTDGRLEIDNNLTEQEIKPFVIARKNFMFSQSMDGAHALCTHFSLVRTALLHGLKPYDYYVALLRAIPHCNSVEDYEKLLPWNIQLSAKSE